MPQRRSPGDGTLFKRADGIWVGRVELPPGRDGKRRQKPVYAKDRNTAQAKLRQLKADVAAGQIPTTRTTTLGRWLDYWLTDIMPTRGVKPSTATSYSNTVRLYLQPHLGRRRLDRLQPAEIRDAYTLIASEVGTRAAQKADQVLRLAITAALRDGVVGSDVMTRVDKPGHVKAEAQPFGLATAMHVIRTAEKTQGPIWGARWATGFLTGARESEILGLEWDRVDLDAGTITISWQLQRLPMAHGCGDTCGKTRPSYCSKRQWAHPPGEHRPLAGALVFTRPKTRAGMRTIPIVPELAAILRTIRDETPNPHGLVFHQQGKPIDQETDQKAWRQLLHDAGLQHRFQHNIRHSTATLLLAAGVDTHVIQSVIGHSDIAVTRGYQHVDLTMARKAWGSLSALLPGEEN